MGDFNFDSSWKQEQQCIDAEFDDIYLTLNKGIESFTMPSNGHFKAWRPDKILARKTSSWNPKQISIIGKFSIPSCAHEDPLSIAYDSKVRTPSDHYGLYSIFDFQTQ